MEDRQHVDQHVARLPAPVVLERERVAQEVAVAEHRALAAPGGAAGVEDGGQVVGRAHGRHVHIAVPGGPVEQAAGAVFVEREDVRRAGLESDLAHPAEVLARAHHHARLGVADEVLDLAGLVGGVERQEHQAGAQHGQVEHQCLDRLFGLHGHTRSGRERQRVEQVGQHCGAAVEVAPGVEERCAGAVAGFDGRAVEVGRELAVQGAEKVLVVVHVAQGNLQDVVTAQPRWKRGGLFSMKAITPSRCSALSA